MEKLQLVFFFKRSLFIGVRLMVSHTALRLRERVEVAMSSIASGWQVNIWPVLSTTSQCGWLNPFFVQCFEINASVSVQINCSLHVLCVVLPWSPAIPEWSVVVGIAITSPVSWVEPISVPLVSRPEWSVLVSQTMWDRVHIQLATGGKAVGLPVEWSVERVTINVRVIQSIVISTVFMKSRRVVRSNTNSWEIWVGCDS